jgi:excisionase family DNA binding protein
MSPKSAAVQDDLLTAVDAAKILGLSADMVRLLAREGRLPAAAQTTRGLRLFRRSDVEELASERAGEPVNKHVVQFYDKDEVLCATVANLMGVTLRSGAPVIIVAIEAHRNEFCERLQASGLDVARACDSGQLTLHDARSLLDSFAVDGVLDTAAFHANVVPIIEAAIATRPRPRLRAYGEMVDLLAADGYPDASLQLEELWNELARVHSFAILCAYRMSSFRDPALAERFQQICATHTHVVPAESYQQDGKREDGLREIALLQQRARSLESEIEQRKASESALRDALAERQRAEEELRQSREELRRKNRHLEDATRAKDELLALVGHELRNPLAPIQTAFELMRLRGLESREQSLIERQVRLLSQLADDLLDVSRLTRGTIEAHPQRVDLAAIVARAVESSDAVLNRRRNRLEVQVAEGHAVLVDPDHMIRVVAKLLTNAAKFSDFGSSILVRAARDGSRVRLSVKDEGVGIAPDQVARLFESCLLPPPSTPERPAGGLGLSLAIVRSLVKLHGGTVEVHSEGPGKGSEFVVELPAAEPAPVDEPCAAATARRVERSGPRKRVLVVDDNADLASLTAELLEHLGHEVETAHDGASALDVAVTFQPEVALLDIGLPNMDGYELARRLSVLREGKIRLVALTGYGHEDDRRRSEEAGFCGHLVKPVRPEHLASAVEPSEQGG